LRLLYIDPVVVPASEYLRLSDVGFGYEPDRPVLTSLSLSLPPGKGVIVSGPVGCGKSTLVNLIIGLLTPTSGEILVRNRSYAGISHSDRARLLRSWGVILDIDTILPDRSIDQNIAAAVRISAARARANTEEIEAMMQLTGLAGARRRHPSTLSAREKRLLQVVIACARNPIFLIWDDPDSGLDGTELKSALDIVRRRHLAGTAVLLTTSRPRRYESLGWRVVDLSGREA
jgi:cell division transport system ATP-binding protein